MRSCKAGLWAGFWPAGWGGQALFLESKHRERSNQNFSAVSYTAKAGSKAGEKPATVAFL